MNVRKGDTVHIVSGKERGKEGQVLRVFPVRARASVQGVNIYTKHVKPKGQGQTGQKIEVPRAVPVSNMMVVCPSCKRPTRVGHRTEGDKKVRVCKRCNSTF